MSAATAHKGCRCVHCVEEAHRQELEDEQRRRARQDAEDARRREDEARLAECLALGFVEATDRVRVRRWYEDSRLGDGLAAAELDASRGTIAVTTLWGLGRDAWYQIDAALGRAGRAGAWPVQSAWGYGNMKVSPVRPVHHIFRVLRDVPAEDLARIAAEVASIASEARLAWPEAAR